MIYECSEKQKVTRKWSSYACIDHWALGRQNIVYGKRVSRCLNINRLDCRNNATSTHMLEVVGRIHFLRRAWRWGDVVYVCCRWIWHEYTSDKGSPSRCWSLPETFSARKSWRRRLMSRCRNVRIVSKNRVKKADLRCEVLRLQRGVNRN